MTREEAIQILSTRDRYGVPCGYTGGYTEVFDMAIEALHKTKWIPVSERLPEEHEWIGTKTFGTTISDKVLVTFDVDGTRFVKPLSLQNGKLSRPDAQTMDVFHKGWKMLAWMPLPEPYREDGEE